MALDPVLTWVRAHGGTSMTLIPCGYLAAFPLSGTLLYDGHPIEDCLPTSIAPSARSLLREVLVDSSRNGVYAIGDPQENLGWSAAEAYTFTNLAQQHSLSAAARVGKDVTREWLLSALQKGFVVDASCHGTFDRHDFLHSALHLTRGQQITMGEMLAHQADLRGLRLLLLSACQTAILDLRGARDEMHSLAVAVLQAGAQAVLASQWAVDDEATYLLMVRFAQEWLPNMQDEQPATALLRAQSWLRTVTNAELRTWGRKLPKLPADTLRANDTHSPLPFSPVRQTIYRWQYVAVRGRTVRYTDEDARLLIRLKAEQREPRVCPYADPYYWAGFQVIGW
jgi:CHAT domain-containing protein